MGQGRAADVPALRSLADPHPGTGPGGHPEKESPGPPLPGKAIPPSASRLEHDHCRYRPAAGQDRVPEGALHQRRCRLVRLSSAPIGASPDAGNRPGPALRRRGWTASPEAGVHRGEAQGRWPEQQEVRSGPRPRACPRSRPKERSQGIERSFRNGSPPPAGPAGRAAARGSPVGPPGRDPGLRLLRGLRDLRGRRRRPGAAAGVGAGAHRAATGPAPPPRGG